MPARALTIDAHGCTLPIAMNIEGQSVSDEDLLQAWRAGDRAAGQALISRHHTSVARFFSNKLGPESEDLIQATFIGLLEAAPRFRGDACVRTLIFAIARNKLNYHLRDLMRDRKRHFDPSEMSLVDLGTTPTGLRARRDEKRLLLLALRMLPLDTQIMFELHYWESMKIAEIAEVVELSLANVKVRMHRGRKALARLMEELAESKTELESTWDHLSAWANRMREELD